MPTIEKRGEHVSLPADTAVEVYLHFGKTRSAGHNVYSIRDARTKLVIGHTDTLDLTDVTFHVSQVGRERVVREQRKNVHAWIVGIVTTTAHGSLGEMVWYDPYKTKEFTRLATGRPVHTAERVSLRQYHVYAQGAQV